MKKKVLVLGSTGMLGHMVLKVLSKAEGIDAWGTHIGASSDPLYFDVKGGLENLASICKLKEGIHYIINCIGITAVNIDASDSKAILHAIRINAAYPHELAEFAEQRNIRVIHISTDGVFSGRAENYDEDAPCDCTDIYGKTKRLGEAVNPRLLNIRCSIIGPSPYEQGGIYEWFMSQPDNTQVSGYTNHFWNGVSTLQFAELCLLIIMGEHFDSLRHESHIFHFVPNSPLSKYELIKLMHTASKKNITVIPLEHGGGIVRRVLKTKYKGIMNIYPVEGSMEEVISRMIMYK